MKKSFFSFLISLALCSITGCSVLITERSGTKPVQMNTEFQNIVFPYNTEQSLPASGFRTIDGNWCSGQTEVFLQRKKDEIQIRFVCYANTAKMRFSKKEKDDNMNLFGGEHVELLLAPNGLNDGIYYHIAINPAGSIYHAKLRDLAWTPQYYNLKIEKLNDRWIATLVLPYSALGIKTPPADGSVWLANFCRTYAPNKGITEHSSLSGSKNFHDLNSMTKVIFGSNAPKVSLQIRSVHQQPDGTLKIHTGKYGRTPVEIQVLLNGKCLRSYPLTAPDHFEHVFTIQDNDPYIPLKNNRLLTLRMNDLQGNTIDEKSGYLYSVDQNFLLLDQYVYFKNDPIRFDVLVTPGKFRIKQENKVIAEIPVSALKNVYNPTLAPGRYVAEYEVNGKYTSCVFMVQEKKPQRMARMPGKFAVSGSDLTLNGKPVYLFSTSDGKLKNYPYHPDYTYRYGAGARNHAIIRNSIPHKRFIRKPKSGYAFDQDFEKKLEQFINNQKKHQNSNIVYLLAYEANMKAFMTLPDKSYKEVDSPTLYRTIYTKMKQGLPNAKIVLHIDDLNRLNEFAQACDILEFATDGGSYNGVNMMLNLKKDLLHVRANVKQKPLILWLGGSIPNPLCRTPEEIRAGVYCSILNGAAGNIVHMGHGGIPPHRTRFWSMLAALPREIDSFYGNLKTWEEVKDFVIPAGLDGKAVISPDGELLLVLLNNTLSEKKVTLELPGTYGKRTMTFTPLEPRVLRIKKK